MSSLALYLRAVLGRQLTYDEGDANFVAIRDAINDLASITDAAKGAARIGFNRLLSYPPGTVGASILDALAQDELVPFCLGDGVTTKFLSDGSPIYRTDANGRNLLTTTPRTNLFFRSEDITNWSTATGTPVSTPTTLEDNNAASAAHRVSPASAVPQDSLNYVLSFYVEKRNTIAAFTAKLTGGTLVQWSVGLDTANGNATPLTSASNGAFWMVEDKGSLGWKVTIFLQNNNTAAKTGSLDVYPSWGLHQDPATNGYYWPTDPTATGIVGVTKCQLEIAADQSSRKFLVFGDSLSAGSSITPTWWQMLGLAPSCFSNYAVGSTTSAQARTAYDAHKTESCTDVAVQTGVNSLAAGLSAATIYADLVYIWADAKARGKRVWAHTIPPWKGSAGWDAAKQTETEALNALILSDPSLYDDCEDLYGMFGDPGNPGAFLPLYQRTDLIHPAPLASYVWANDVKAKGGFPSPYSSYIGPTLAASMSTTDYSVAGHVATLGIAPAAGALLEGLAVMKGAVEEDLQILTVGKGVSIKEGTNAKMGTATLVGGTVTVNTTAVTANSRIFLTPQTSGAAPGALRVSARVSGTSFTITSASGTDTSAVAWMIVEPL